MPQLLETVISTHKFPSIQKMLYCCNRVDLQYIDTDWHHCQPTYEEWMTG